jgi:hypothetical protein
MNEIWREEWSVKIGRKCMKVGANEISDASLIANCEILMWYVVYMIDVNWMRRHWKGNKPMWHKEHPRRI